MQVCIFTINESKYIRYNIKRIVEIEIECKEKK